MDHPAESRLVEEGTGGTNPAGEWDGRENTLGKHWLCAVVELSPIEMLQLKVSVEVLISGDFVQPRMNHPSQYPGGVYCTVYSDKHSVKSLGRS